MWTPAHTHRLLVFGLVYLVSIPIVACVVPFVEMGAWFPAAFFIVIPAFCVGLCVGYSALLCRCLGYPLDETAPLGRFAVAAFPLALLAIFCGSKVSAHFGGFDLAQDLMDLWK